MKSKQTFKEWKQEVHKEAKCLGITQKETEEDLSQSGARHFIAGTAPFDYAVFLSDALSQVECG